MDDLTYSIHQLTDVIADTQEFRQYKILRQEVGGDSALNQLLAQFEDKRKRLYTSQLSQDQYQRLADELNGDYANLNTYPILKQYFTAEDNFNRLLARGVIQSLNGLLEQKLR